MAVGAFANILTAIREVIEDSTGSVRTAPSNRFRGGLYSGLDRDAGTLRALGAPIVETEIVRRVRSESGCVVNSNVQLRDIEVEVRVIRSITLTSKIDDATRDAAKAAALADGDYIDQALTWPGNLTQTSAAGATGLISGMLVYVDSDATVEADEETGARIITTHRFTGTTNVATAVS